MTTLVSPHQFLRLWVSLLLQLSERGFQLRDSQRMLQEQQGVAAARLEENEFLKRQVGQLQEQLAHSDALTQQYKNDAEDNHTEAK
jgi:hypothetical protein